LSCLAANPGKGLHAGAQEACFKRSGVTFTSPSNGGKGESERENKKGGVGGGAKKPYYGNSERKHGIDGFWKRGVFLGGPEESHLEELQKKRGDPLTKRNVKESGEGRKQPQTETASQSITLPTRQRAGEKKTLVGEEERNKDIYEKKKKSKKRASMTASGGNKSLFQLEIEEEAYC